MVHNCDNDLKIIKEGVVDDDLVSSSLLHVEWCWGRVKRMKMEQGRW